MLSRSVSTMMRSTGRLIPSSTVTPKALLLQPGLQQDWAEVRGLYPQRRLRLRIDPVSLQTLVWEQLAEERGGTIRPVADDPNVLLFALFARGSRHAADSR